MSSIISTSPDLPIRRIYSVRALGALVWAAALALALAVGDSLSATESLPVAVSILLVVYPVIDVIATFVEARARRRDAGASASQLINAAMSAVTAVAIGVAASNGTDAVLRVFGAWAVVAGVIQLALAIVRRRRGTAGQVPMILAGGISVPVGGAFIQMAAQDEPQLTSLTGYAVLGAIFFLISTARLKAQQHS